ncbi:alpha-L-fucosidase [Sediminitomix flava]|uniref:alpha-L-fucosidase n=1 Tax=Sediminitomix flava TaxID=379075 RepID=A0A315Z4B9_SEDFL|nr:alpha-L-fucosidase [Sediminitomix flava]PWJ37924.1 alpha-L-fucosidase [Sediminitomix flava]
MNKILFFGLCLGLFACQKQENQNAKKQKYEANWESLAKHKAAPEWFTDAKLGIYFHWGPYSVPAFGSAWYPSNMYKRGSRVNQFHEEHFGKIEKFGYQDFIPRFRAEHFDPEEWAELFQSTGAKFAGPVAQHHDGFAMWQSEINPWNAKAMGPKRDILGELFEALESRDLKTIATFHHARNGQRNIGNESNWGKNGYNSHYPYAPDLPTATTDPKLRKLFGNFEDIDTFNQYWLDQVNEVVDKYHPDILWYDSWLNLIPENYRLQMAAHHLNKGLENEKEVALCHKQEDLPLNLSILDIEQGGKKDIYPMDD